MKLFTDDELEAIENILLDYGHQWAETSVDNRLLDGILEKIDRLLNG